jgi:tRNA pseudouridine(55) synthase
LNDDAKCYDFELHFGQQTSSDDAEGAVVATDDYRPSLDQIAAAIPTFVGAIDQRPPAFSAIKLAGRPAYELARAGQAPTMAMRRVRIDALEVVSSDQLPDCITLRVTCGGHHVRSLARDLAVAVGTVGHARAIRRLEAAARRWRRRNPWHRRWNRRAGSGYHSCCPVRQWRRLTRHDGNRCARVRRLRCMTMIGGCLMGAS